MKKLRKTVGWFLLFAMLLCCFSVIPVMGETTPQMLFHYDFQGETDAERLQNKAANGDTGSLKLTGNLSRTEQGYAFVHSAQGNYFSVPVGSDVKNIGDQATFSLVFKAEGDNPKLMGDVGQIGKTVRLMLGVNNQLYIRVGSNITTSESTQKTVGTAAVPRNRWIHIAVALDLSEAGVVKETVFLSVDGGKSYQTFSFSVNGADGMFPDATDLLLGKVNPNISDRGTSFYYRDVRLYNGLLNETELRKIEVGEDEVPVIPPDADDSALPARKLDEFLVVHYDFLGKNEEEQLSDKAPAGVSHEDLLLYSTVDENNQKLSYIKDGVAYIDRARSNFLFAIPGEDITGIGKEMTVFVAFHLSADATRYPGDILNMDHTLRLAMHNRNYVFDRVGGGALDTVGAESEVLERDQWIYATIRLTYDETYHVVYQKLFLSPDEGKTYTQYTATTTQVETMFSGTTYLLMGKATPTIEERGTDFQFKDIRIYNCAVRPSELDQIVVAEPQADPGASTDPGEKEPPAETDSGEKNGDTTAVPGDSETGGEKPDVSGGCRSALPGGGMAILLPALCMAAGAAVMRAKKKGRRARG